MRKTCRTSENPLVCSPLDGIPSTRSPARTFPGSSSRSRSTIPTANPARSSSPSAYICGICAVSPPIRAHCASRQPQAMPRISESRDCASTLLKAT